MSKVDDFAFKQLELDRLVDEFGMLEHPGVAADFKMRHAEYEIQSTDDGRRVLRHTATGELADSAKHLAHLHQTKPHFFPQKVEASLLERCFGSAPSLSARGELRREITEAEFAKHASEWGSDPVRLKPGQAPGSDGAPVAPKPASATNPWSNHPSNVDPRTGRYTAAAIGRQAGIVRSLGAGAAAGMSAAAGVFLGATSPKSARLTPR